MLGGRTTSGVKGFKNVDLNHVQASHDNAYDTSQSVHREDIHSAKVSYVTHSGEYSRDQRSMHSRVIHAHSVFQPGTQVRYRGGNEADERAGLERESARATTKSKRCDEMR